MPLIVLFHQTDNSHKTKSEKIVKGVTAIIITAKSICYTYQIASADGWDNNQLLFRKKYRPGYQTSRAPVYLFSVFFLLVFFDCIAAPGITFGDNYSGIPYTQRPYIVNNQKFYPIPSSNGYSEEGIASWYGPDFHGRRTSNGEIYNMHNQTAAHKILPMNTMLLVENLENGLQTVVRINDRGPFVYGRIIDLSYKAAGEIGLLKNGTAQVRITALMNNLPTLENLKKNRIPDFYKGRFFVQIGSFVSRTNASRLQERFVRAGHKAVTQEFSNNGVLFYRVQVWVGTDLRFARRARQALEDKGYRQAFIVAR